LLAPAIQYSRNSAKILYQLLFLPKDKDEIEALNKGLFKARTRVTMMP